MSTRTDLVAAAVLALSLTAAITDLARGRIYNWLTLPGLLAGCVAAFWWGGAGGLLDSFAGAGAGLLLYGWMFWLRVLGGGDVKLLMALGAWGGFHFAEEVSLLGVLLGGALACALILLRGKMPDFIGKIRKFLLSALVPGLVLQLPGVDRGNTMPFGVPIAAAAVWTVLSHPLVGWGFKPWP